MGVYSRASKARPFDLPGLLSWGKSADQHHDRRRLSIFRGYRTNSFKRYGCATGKERNLAMVFVEMRLNSLDLLSHMADMRIWLDRNCVNDTGFSYKDDFDRVLARVAFNRQSEAEAFAARFAGRVIFGNQPIAWPIRSTAAHGSATDRHDSDQVRG
jgi:hypothetical protein